MVVIVNGDGGGEGGGDETTASYTFLGAEPTLYAFSPDHVEDAQRMSFRADSSGVVYSLTVSGEALKHPDVIANVAGIWANNWNENAAVPGVEEIEDGQEVSTLGSVQDVVNVAVTSTSGRSTTIVQVTQRDMEPAFFAPVIKTTRAQLDAIEAGG